MRRLLDVNREKGFWKIRGYWVAHCKTIGIETLKRRVWLFIDDESIKSKFSSAYERSEVRSSNAFHHPAPLRSLHTIALIADALSVNGEKEDVTLSDGVRRAGRRRRPLIAVCYLRALNFDRMRSDSYRGPAEVEERACGLA
jgi:hypothetical protein